MKLNLSLLTSALCVGCMALSYNAQATIVEFETSVGNVKINLYDNITPVTVENFLHYVTDGRYNYSVFHRSEANFVIQGGGYTYVAGAPNPFIETFDYIVNEPKLSNVRGTIAMAKNSAGATSQFYFNLVNNAANLDVSANGYTVFGEVVEGMEFIDEIGALPRFDLTGDLKIYTPLRNLTPAEAAAGIPLTEDHWVIIYSATIFDAAPDTAADLSPVANAYYVSGDSVTLPPTPEVINNGGGGNFGVVGLLMLFAAGAWRRIQHTSWSKR